MSWGRSKEPQWAQSMDLNMKNVCIYVYKPLIEMSFMSQLIPEKTGWLSFVIWYSDGNYPLIRSACCLQVGSWCTWSLITLSHSGLDIWYVVPVFFWPLWSSFIDTNWTQTQGNAYDVNNEHSMLQMWSGTCLWQCSQWSMIALYPERVYEDWQVIFLAFLWVYVVCYLTRYVFVNAHLSIKQYQKGVWQYNVIFPKESNMLQWGR